MDPESVVAPRAGAWIETTLTPERQPVDEVAPRAGAWIETSDEADHKTGTA